ncbi:hypothetical protein F5888DRAFT_1017983 [Russula emetica]|nr:hypothetical protein F5888DRAFT_1017983 [Russula emetica]
MRQGNARLLGPEKLSKLRIVRLFGYLFIWFISFTPKPSIPFHSILSTASNTGSGLMCIRTASRPGTIQSQGNQGAVYYTQSRKKQILLYNSHRVADYANRTGPPANSPSVGSSDPPHPGRQGTDAWCARGRAHARRCGNYIRPKVSLKGVDGMPMSMSGLSGSTTSPLTIDGTKICESG